MNHHHLIHILPGNHKEEEQYEYTWHSEGEMVDIVNHRFGEQLEPTITSFPY